MNKLANYSGLFLLFILTGCATTASDAQNAAASLPTPTTFHFFEDSQGIDSTAGVATRNPVSVPTVANLFTERDTPTPQPTVTPLPTFPPATPQTGSVASGETDLFSYPVFEDTLNNNWEIQETIGATVDTSGSTRVLNGRHSIAFTPDEDFTTLFFTVKPDSTMIYPAEKVLALSFWLNGGDDYIQLEQLALSVIGSNDYTYWNPDDDSVEFPGGESFSETRLYFLGLNRSIPPNTWTEIYLQLDSLIYDPEYNYVVGFYLKNDFGFRNTVYIDNVTLVLLEDPTALETDPVQVTPTAVRPTPTTTAVPTVTAETPGASATVAGTAVATPSNSPTPTETAEPEACTVAPPPGWVQYTIQSGDNIATLAFNRGESVEFVFTVNCFRPGVVLSIGQVIWLPPAP